MDELTEAVNLALDRVQSNNGLTNDDQLAEHIGAANRAVIWRWRRGKFTKAFRTIIPLTVMVNEPLPAGWAEQAVDIRVLAPLLKMPNIDA